MSLYTTVCARVHVRVCSCVCACVFPCVCSGPCPFTRVCGRLCVLHTGVCACNMHACLSMCSCVCRMCMWAVDTHTHSGACLQRVLGSRTSSRSKAHGPGLSLPSRGGSPRQMPWPMSHEPHGHTTGSQAPECQHVTSVTSSSSKGPQEPRLPGQRLSGPRPS